MKFREYLQESKSPAVKYILDMMDSEEDGQDRYKEFVDIARKKFNIDKDKLEKELDKYI